MLNIQPSLGVYALASPCQRNMFGAKGAAFIASPPQDGFAVANLGQRPRIR
jgi:hypothetical protein